MFKTRRVQGLLIFAAGLLAGLMIAGVRHIVFPKAALAQDASKGAPDLAAMQADIAHLKEVVPSQSHTMTDVGYQFANLWFAGKHRNWPLADFFLNEARQHIVWTIRIRPVRKNPDGGSIDAHCRRFQARDSNADYNQAKDGSTGDDHPASPFLAGYIRSRNIHGGNG